jgi:signal transduction histidine kinase
VYRLEFNGNLDSLGESINISLYRIVQECLTNIAKHAMATEVHVELGIIRAYATDKLPLVVQDNGTGMDSHKPGGGLGLIGMRERVEALAGEFELATAPGSGMRITVRLPMGEKSSYL